MVATNGQALRRANRSFGIEAATQRRLIKYLQELDQPERISDDLTFVRLATLLRDGDKGDIATLVQLWQEMNAKDARLRGVVQTRINALTGLEWEIVGDDAAAIYVREVIEGMKSFTDALRTLAKGIPVNIAALELIWSGVRLVRLKGVPHSRFIVDWTKSPDLRLMAHTGDEGFIPPANKFVIHVPDRSSINPWADTIAVSQAKLWLAKNLVWADWAHFAELFGQPIRIGSYSDGEDEGEKTRLLNAMRDLGNEAYAIKHVNSLIEFIEVGNRQLQPFADMIEYIERNQAVGLLGGNLTTDTTGGTGTFAAASVQNLIRRDLLLEDVKAERHSIETGIFAPMVALRFPGQAVKVPEFVRDIPEAVDVAVNVQALNSAGLIGLKVTNGEAYRMLGITPPDGVDLDGELVFPAPVAAPGGFGG